MNIARVDENTLPLNASKCILSKFISTDVMKDKSISVAWGDQDIGSIGRLRYELFIERDRKAYSHADVTERSFIEPIDAKSLNFYVSSAAECVAAMRVCWAEDALADPHLKLVIEHSGVAPQSIPEMIVTSRLAVRDNRAAKLKMLVMFQEACVIGVLNGARYACISCRPELAKLFERLGLKESGQRYRDRVAGAMSVMVLDIADHEYLLKSASPFASASDLYLSIQK